MSDELEKLALTHHHPFNNLTNTEIQALLNPEKDKSLVIKPSDKGGNLVLMNHCTYKGQLSTSIYRKPTSSNNLLHWDSHHPVPLK